MAHGRGRGRGSEELYGSVLGAGDAWSGGGGDLYYKAAITVVMGVRVV